MTMGDDAAELERAVEGQRVELIEAKWTLNTDVIGQLLCGAFMFSRQFPNHGPIELTAVVAGANDGGLRWFCNLERINVEIVVPVQAGGET